MTEPQATAPKAEPQKEKVGIGAYIALALAVILFSGVFYKMPAGKEWLGAFDFTTLIGHFGTIAGSKNNFTGATAPAQVSSSLFLSSRV
mgnify:CR=1 FL=1